MVFSRSFSLTSPPLEILGVRVLTVNVRVTNCPAVVCTFSSIRRRNSALTVVVEGPLRSPSVTVTRVIALGQLDREEERTLAGAITGVQWVVAATLDGRDLRPLLEPIAALGGVERVRRDLSVAWIEFAWPKSEFEEGFARRGLCGGRLAHGQRPGMWSKVTIARIPTVATEAFMFFSHERLMTIRGDSTPTMAAEEESTAETQRI